MRKLYLISTVVLIALFSSTQAFGQDFSNKGKDFYLCFPAHVPSGNNLATLSIWITSDKASSGTVTMGNFAFSANFNIPANGRAEIQVPHAAAHVSNGESNMVIRKSIRIKTDPGKPGVVAYAQLWAGFRSAATLVLPVNVLGKKYYSVNFTPNAGGRSQFDIIAVKDNTVVQITPYLNGVKGTSIIINLPLAGDMYQYQSSNTTADLTGTFIESIVSPTGGCLPIAVFSGASNMSMGTSSCSSFNSSDPLFQQLYPISTWGKNFGFMPFANYPNGNPYRVLASEDNTRVFFDGALVAILNAGQIYPAVFTSQPATLNSPTNITADKPICVAQYAQSAGCNGLPGSDQGDPDMVVLNPIEQSIKDITIFSTRQQGIASQWLNILVKTSATPSFMISRNGGPLNPPTGTWQPFAPLPGYSYLRELLPTPGDGGIGSPPGTISDSYRLLADSGFNAICYGWGNFESYSYSAGTNVKDLYQQIGVSTEFGIEPTPSVCKGSPFRFKVSLPYCADSILWDLSFLPGPPTPPATVIYTSCTPGAGGPDSTTVVNGITLYWYSLPSSYNFNTAGTFPVTITIYTPNTDGCGSEQEIDFELNVFDPPVADFTFTSGGCAAEPVQFTDNTVTPRPSYIWNWNFGDPGSGASNTSTLQNPTHIFSGPGTYNVTFSTITTPGCISGQIIKPVTVLPPPSGTISGGITVCLNAPSPDITFTGVDGRPPYTFTYNINGGPNQTISTTGTNTSVTLQPPTNVAGTFRYNLVEVRNTGSTLCFQPVSNSFIDIIVVANVTMSLTSPAGTNNQTICENTPIANIIYTINGGTGATVTGLPAGVNGVYNAGLFTISGTPVGGGTFNYTVTTTGPCGQQTANGTITVNPDAVITLTSPGATTNQQLCVNTPVANITYAISGGGTGAGVTGLPAGVTGVFSGGVFTISGLPTVIGTFNYTVTTTGTCVQKTATGTITIGADAVLTLTSGPSTTTQNVCINIPITTITYTVSAGGNGASVTGLPAGVTGSFAGGVVTITGTPTVTGTFPYTVTTTGTCAQQTASGTITVGPDATLVLTSAPTTVLQEMCFNTSIINITYAVGGGATNVTVSGLPAGVTGVYSGAVLTISGTATVSGTFNYTVTTTGTCVQRTETGTIIINPLPTASFNASVPACDTRVISFTDLSTPNVGSLVSWNWNFGDPPSGANNTSTLQNPTHIFTTTGTYNVTLTVSNDKNCVSSPVLSIPITVSSKPIAGFMVPEVCINDVAALFTDTSKIVNGTLDPAGYEWDFGDPGSGPLNTSNTKDGSHLYTAVGSYTVRHIATSTLGCKDTVYHDIFINGANPNADFSVQNPAALCSSDSVSITNLSTISAGSITKVEIIWDFAGAPTVIETDDFPTPNKVYKHKYPTLQTSTTYTIRFRAYSGTLCQDLETKNIVVNATPKVQFLDMPDVCLDAAPFQITQASEIGGVPGPPGLFSGPGVSPSGIFNPALVGPGTYNIKFTFTSTAGGCIDSLSKSITVLDTASAQFSFSALTCEKTAVNFSSIASTIPPGVGTITGWVWDFGDPASGAANTSSVQNPTHLFSSWGTYTVRLYVTTSRGCRSTVRTIPVTVNPIARPNFTFPASACLPSATVAFNSAASSIPDGTQASFSYLWNFGDPASGALNTATGSSPSHIYNTAGPFNVNLQITSGAGCIHDTTIVLNTIHPQPTGSFTANRTDVCVGQSFTFTDNSNPADGTTTQYSWAMGDGNTRTTSTVNYSYSAAGSYDVTLFITNSHGCRSTVATRTVTVNPYPSVNAGPDLFILQGGSDTLEPIITNDINPTYLWTPNQYFIGSNTIKNPVVSGVEDITYTLLVTGRGGCSAQDQVFVKVLKGPEIPNIFSPNGDGIHDRWDIKYLDTYPGGTVEIFNRYGQMIWRSVGYGTPWDGTIGGNPVPIGTYYYIVNPKNGRGIMSGYVDVIR